MPGTNAPPMHPSCHCSTAAYEDSADYEAWLDYLDKGGTTEQWNAQKAKIPVAKSGESGIIKTKNIKIHKSAGAKAKNYNVKLPDGIYANFTEGTRITNIATIAGKGRDRKIDEVDFLIEKYGGQSSEWQKKKGIGYLDCGGESYKAEVHWYEEPKAGKHKFKAKSHNGEWIIDE